MDLYGGTASISQANALTQQAQQINLDNANFNNSLAEQLDQAILENNEDATQKMTKNITSAATSGGKIAFDKDVRGYLKTKGKKLVGREVPISLREKMAKESSDQFLARTRFVEAEAKSEGSGIFAVGEDIYAAAEEEAERYGGGIRETGAIRLAEEGGETLTALSSESGEAVSNVAGAAKGGKTTIQTSEGVVEGGKAAKAVVQGSEGLNQQQRQPEKH